MAPSWSSSRSLGSLGGKYRSGTKPPEGFPDSTTKATFNLWYVILTHNVLGVLIIIAGTLSSKCVLSAVVETNQKAVLSATSAKGNVFSV